MVEANDVYRWRRRWKKLGLEFHTPKLGQRFHIPFPLRISYSSFFHKNNHHIINDSRLMFN